MPKKNIDLKARKLFIETIAGLKNDLQVEEFLKDLFSSAEIKDFSRRILAAKMLQEGKTYQEITFDMGMSAGTINKIYFKTKGSRLMRGLFG
jgi:TrpR-related protein YerC/YecD